MKYFPLTFDLSYDVRCIVYEQAKGYYNKLLKNNPQTSIEEYLPVLYCQPQRKKVGWCTAALKQQEIPEESLVWDLGLFLDLSEEEVRREINKAIQSKLTYSDLTVSVFVSCQTRYVTPFNWEEEWMRCCFPKKYPALPECSLEENIVEAVFLVFEELLKYGYNPFQAEEAATVALKDLDSDSDGHKILRGVKEFFKDTPLNIH